jgi:tryptophanyl-tRNA synthetase
MDPWGSDAVTDYDRLQEEFGIEPLREAADLPDPPPIFRREVVFGQRGWPRIQRAIDRGEDWAVMTGLMPSGPMHVGHKMVIDQVTYYQELGADVIVGVADLEAYWTRDVDLDEARELAIENYLKNYIALGLDPDSCRVYFQSENRQVQDLARDLAPHVNFSTMRSIYGFGSETNMGHVMAPLIQVADILHVQEEEWGGPRPTVVPVGVDQDPHIRLTRDLAAKSRIYNVQWTDDDRVGVFVTPDEDVDAYLEAAADTLQDEGYLAVESNPEYKALYLPGAARDDVGPVDEALARLEPELGGTGFVAPAATYHRFMTGLTGGKMSSSEPDSAVFLEDPPDEAADKLDRAKTGGRATAAEQREKGANPDDCMIYEMFLYHLVDDDEELATIYQESQDGDRLCGDCKGLARDRASALLENLADGREKADEVLDDYLQHPEVV